MPLPDARTLVETAYAKVNLALHVRERRADGYHALESLFAFARDGDLLAAELTDDGEVRLQVDGPFGAALDAGADNLVTMAARLLQQHTGEERGAVITLTKNLPIASGIGGGSADAAAALRLLNRLWDARLPAAELEQLGLALGSDVPACISSVTQMVRGRGEILEQRDVKALVGMPMLLVNPGVPLSTARVFKGWDRQDRGPLDVQGLDDVITGGRNDLEASAMEVAPIIAQVLGFLKDQRGVRLARMSGSGATCFALFDDAVDRSAVAKALLSQGGDWWIMETEIR
ncbi:4-diphosphocytidyl-2-C-methyl-D-erythritol kinase [Sphingobium herbicidovorans NBRC 16415]|uniref:4-diphosphocytidyl-2-C-methyl-D-erythritol kinase n=1 Tax=Sphingobium herbicidovorans (strain ATCC 700291 / DSM 11019 / CCUG 56400 / KCTC 2939 / LMG 18315 / NBRC 16415 / MH) TaxID=1219045 RepID=A0A086P5N5_SPHHM|nr:4-(cytidine 5'-diphospho)-2-C-methyl-D-erythritol kinase [Sphingobium herbicidovorans]KFG88703.1 4-diphosphocytidyl-2-C-methyl-D-erythritol kinase [Sphingobium herbicidovorans NBRC 16415]